MANEQNLKPFTSDQDREEAAKNGRKGGIKSGEVRRRNKTLREIMQSFASRQIQLPELKARMEKLGYTDEELTNHAAVTMGLWQEAVKGNVNAIKEYQIMMGEQIDETNINVNVNPFEGMSTDELRSLLDAKTKKSDKAKSDN